MSVMSASVRPQRRQPTRLPHPWDSPGKNPGADCHFLLQCMKVKSKSEVSQSWLPCPWDFPGKSTGWSGVPLPSPGIYLPGFKTRGNKQKVMLVGVRAETGSTWLLRREISQKPGNICWTSSSPGNNGCWKWTPATLFPHHGSTR